MQGWEGSGVRSGVASIPVILYGGGGEVSYSIKAKSWLHPPPCPVKLISLLKLEAGQAERGGRGRGREGRTCISLGSSGLKIEKSGLIGCVAIICQTVNRNY